MLLFLKTYFLYIVLEISYFYRSLAPKALGYVFFIVIAIDFASCSFHARSDQKWPFNFGEILQDEA